MALPILLSFYSNSVSNLSGGWIMGISGSVLASVWVLSGLLIGPLIYINIYLPLIVIICSYLLVIYFIYNKFINKAHI